MGNFEERAKEILTRLGVEPTEENIAELAADLKAQYNYGRGWKRDREFVSQEKHEQDYERKTPGKTYQKSEAE